MYEISASEELFSMLADIIRTDTLTLGSKKLKPPSGSFRQVAVKVINLLRRKG